jgi:NADH:ubiquinone oxidoreductase subunit C
VNPFDRLPEAAAEIFGEGATAQEAYGLLTVDVPAATWVPALETARDQLGCTYFDWLSAVDEPGTGFAVCAHLVSLPEPGGVVRRLLVRTTVPHEAAELPTATGVFAGAAWHERETHEMFGIAFTGHPYLVPLLLPEGFEGHPLRKDFVLAARVAKAWPGAKEPGESDHGGPKRRQMLPPGVPDPNEWGPLKGQLPPAPARPARTPRAAAAAPGDRPARRTRSAGEGSASQQAQPGAAPSPRRARSVSEGSASQREAPPATPRKRTPDAPWHQPSDPGTQPAPGESARPERSEPEPSTGPAPAQPAPQGRPDEDQHTQSPGSREAGDRPEGGEDA